MAHPPGEPERPGGAAVPQLPHAATAPPVSIFTDVFQLLSWNAKKMSGQTKPLWVEAGGKEGLETHPHGHLNPPTALTPPRLHLHPLILGADALRGRWLVWGNRYFTILNQAELKRKVGFVSAPSLPLRSP